jgi:macrolide transport system ATP-binding/permease protein
MDWKARVRSAFAGAAHVPDDDVVEELAQHARAMYEAARADGCSHDEADRRVAGQLDRWRRDSASLRRTSHRPPAVEPPASSSSLPLAGFWQELRYAGRLLARSPGFTAIATLSVALGIGVNSTMFSFHDAILFRPLPVREPDSIVTVSANRIDDPRALEAASYADYRDLRDRSRSFDGLIADRLTLLSFARSRDDAREMRMAMLVTENFFTVLGVQPMLGRGFAPDEGSVPGRDAVVVIGYDFWKNTLSGDPSILNSVVLINGIDFHVIGVAPESFTGLDQFVRPTLFVPVMMAPRLGGAASIQLEDRTERAFQIKGRLKRGIGLKSAQAEMTSLWQALEREHPDGNRHRAIAVRTELQERIAVRPSNAIISALMTALAALVLVIACANVANLLLGRAQARSREMAIRLALGVSRTRLLRQLLTESLLLAMLGGAFGIAFAYGGIQFMRVSVAALVQSGFSVVVSPQLDGRVLAFSLGAALISALLFGVAPAWQIVKTRLVPALKSSELSETNQRRTIGRNVLVVAQVALSMVLLIAAGMVQGGFRRTLSLDPGFRTDHLITMALDTSFTQYAPAQTHDFYRDLVDRVRALPGVRSVALADSLPLDRGARMPVIPEGYQFPQGQESVPIANATVDAEYFTTLNTSVVRGRSFTADDDERSRPVAIVNEAFASTYWPNQNPIGKRLRLNNTQSPWLEVVGVTKTERYMFILEPPTPFLYLPFAQHEKPSMALLVETIETNPVDLAAPLRAVVRALDVNQPVFALRTFSNFYQQQATGPQLLVMKVATAMGLLGLILSLVGLYGLVAYSVARRTREIGIRMAIGAGRRDVLFMVLGQGMMLAISGVLVGAIAIVPVTRLLTAGMAGLGVTNPTTYIVVPVLLIGLTLVASYVPARRASKVDPLLALRYE